MKCKKCGEEFDPCIGFMITGEVDPVDGEKEVYETHQHKSGIAVCEHCGAEYEVSFTIYYQVEISQIYCSEVY